MKHVTLADFEFATTPRSGGNSKYNTMFAEVEKGEAGKWYDCEDVLDKGRTMPHNKTNISSCAGKWCAREGKEFKFVFAIAKAKEGGKEVLLVSRTATPKEVEAAKAQK